MTADSAALKYYCKLNDVCTLADLNAAAFSTQFGSYRAYKVIFYCKQLHFDKCNFLKLVTTREFQSL